MKKRTFLTFTMLLSLILLLMSPVFADVGINYGLNKNIILNSGQNVIFGAINNSSNAASTLIKLQSPQGTNRFIVTKDGQVQTHSICDETGSNCFDISSGWGSAGPWSVSGSNVYRSSGNVGIGDATPSGRLDINSPATTDGIYLDGRASLTGYDGDTWLRLNQNSQWTSGVYSPGVIRSDGGFWSSAGASAGLRGNNLSDYGAWRVDGAKGGYGGFNYNNNVTLMMSNSVIGLYNDLDNEWLSYCARNGSCYSYYNGGEKLRTTAYGVQANGGYGRSGHFNGALIGSYNNVGANGSQTNPIYVIGSGYLPVASTLSNMYGIGYTNSAASFVSPGVGGWGMYVAADGDARIWLGASAGGTSYFNAGNVGIGTTAPLAKLHVANGDSSMALFGPNTSWGGYLAVGAGVNQISGQKAQVISTNGNLHLDSSGSAYNTYINYYSRGNTHINAVGGNVGIGVNPFAGSYRLQMGGAINMNNNSIHYASELHFNDNVRFLGVGNDSYMRLKYGDTVLGGIQFVDGSNVLRGYLYSDNNSSFGLASANGGWKVRAHNGGTELYNQTIMTDDTRAYSYRNRGSVSTDNTFGLYFSNNRSSSYAVYREPGAWTNPFPDLRIAFHTGIKLGASANYNGIRFYNDSDMATMVMAVNDASTSGANNVYMANNLGIGANPGTYKLYVGNGDNLSQSTENVRIEGALYLGQGEGAINAAKISGCYSCRNGGGVIRAASFEAANTLFALGSVPGYRGLEVSLGARIYQGTHVYGNSYFADKLSIGTSNYGSEKLRVKGEVRIMSTDSHPNFQFLPFTHDNNGIMFDAYHDGGWKSSDAGSNFAIYKVGDNLRIKHRQGIAQGGDIGVWGDDQDAIRINAWGQTWIKNLSKSGGSFIIDHPLDPENKVLLHSFVESPEMRNIYYGQTEIENGEVEILLPEWWMELNGEDKKEFNYQFTPIGKWCNLYVSKEIEDGRFSVATNDDNCKFSWTISGIRHDAYAEDNRIVVEREKDDSEKESCYYGGACKQK